jgi:hypothetical protein
MVDFYVVTYFHAQLQLVPELVGTISGSEL